MAKKSALSGRAAGAVLSLCLAAGGCVVDNDEYERAQRQRDDLRSELQKLHQGNDQLNQEIARLYGDCEVLSSHVALTAAVGLHDQLAYVPAPRLEADEAPARPTQTRPPAVRPPQVQTRPASTPTQVQPPARPRPIAPAANVPSQSPPAPPPPPPPPPPATTTGLGPGRSGGAVDWGQ